MDASEPDLSDVALGADGSSLALDRKIQVAMASVGLCTFVFALYSPILSSSFLPFDDNLYVTENGVVQQGLTWHGVHYALTSLRGFWQPVVWLVLMSEVQLFGVSPHAFHLVNLVLHMANSLLLFQIALRLSRTAVWPSLTLSALFACHPLTVESVAWIAELKGLLACFFGLLCTLGYIQYRDRRSFGSYSVVAVLYVLGLMAKPSILPLPLLFLVLDHFAPEEAESAVSSSLTAIELDKWWKRLIDKAPLLALGFVFACLTLMAERDFGATRSWAETPLGLRMENAIHAAQVYLRRVVWPSDLCIYYAYDKQLPLLAVLTSGIVLALLTFAAWILRKRFRFLWVSLMGFAVALSPQLGLVQVGGHAMADRYMYIPLMFALAIPVTLWSTMSRGRGYLCAFLPLIPLICLSSVTHDYLLAWRSDRDLFERALKFSPKNNFVAHNIVGMSEMHAGRFDSAIKHFQQVEQIAPHMLMGHHNLALAYELSGKSALALTEYKTSMTLFPRSVETIANYAHFLFSHGVPHSAEMEEAAQLAERAARLDPKDPEKYKLWADILYENGNDLAAKQAFEQGIEALRNQAP